MDTPKSDTSLSKTISMVLQRDIMCKTAPKMWTHLLSRRSIVIPRTLCQRRMCGIMRSTRLECYIVKLAIIRYGAANGRLLLYSIHSSHTQCWIIAPLSPSYIPDTVLVVWLHSCVVASLASVVRGREIWTLVCLLPQIRFWSGLFWCLAM